MEREWEYLSLASGKYWYPENELGRKIVCILTELTLQGHVHLDLNHFSQDLIQLGLKGEDLPTREEVEIFLQEDPLFGGPLENTPFVVHREALYLRNSYILEEQLAQKSRFLLGQTRSFPIEELLAPEGITLTESQKKAALLPLSQSLSVITGGPGTGKTTVIASLLMNYHRYFEEARIQVCAPTGRGAKRVVESLGSQLVSAPWVQETLEEASTLHKLLGYGKKGRPSRNSRNPLKLDLLIIDEASMVDFNMATALLEALPEGARVVLVGDKDQLPAVEGGAYFADLVMALKGQGHPAVVTLDRSHRSSGEVLQLSQAVLDEDGPGMERILNQGKELFLAGVEGPSPHLEEMITRWGWKELLSRGQFTQNVTRWREVSEQIDHLFYVMNKGWILVPENRGYWGVDQVNQRVRELCGMTDFLPPGLPIMIRQNNYDLGLYNGDRGLVLTFQGHPYVFFPGPEGYRFFSPARLPGWEPSFASTIHKSQGSEVERVLLILPSGADRLLSKELLYTGITRAKYGVGILSDKEVLQGIVNRKMLRRSGLSKALQ